MASETWMDKSAMKDQVFLTWYWSKADFHHLTLQIHWKIGSYTQRDVTLWEPDLDVS